MAPGPSYGLTRRLASAKQHEFSINTQFKLGYRNREDLTVLPPGVLIPGSQNVLTNTNGRVAIRQGYSLDGQADSSVAPIASAFDWERSGGADSNLRSGFLTSAANDGKLQFRYVHSDNSVTWEDLLTSLTSVQFNYTTWWNTTTNILEVVFVNADGNLYEWTGATTELLSAANPTGIIATFDTNPNGVAASTDGSGGVDYIVGDILTVSGGSGTATIKVLQTALGAINTTSIGAAGAGYVANDIIIVDGDGQSPYAHLKVLTTGGGGSVSTYSIIANGWGYAVGNNVTTTAQFGGGSGFQLNILTTGLGIYSWAFSSDADHGTGYSTGIAATTGGTGTNATLNIKTVASGSLTKTGTSSWAHAGFNVGNVGDTTLKVVINGTTYTYDYLQTTLGDTTTLYGVTPDPSAEPAGSLVYQSVVITPFTSIGFTQFFRPTLISSINQRLFLGISANTNNSNFARGEIFISGFNDLTMWGSGTSGNVGDPFEITPTSPPTAFIPQEENMYISAGRDEWYDVTFTLSADLQKETVTINRLNTTAQQAAQSQASTSKIANSVIFLSHEPIVRSFGRVPNIFATAPQMSDHSFTIVNDMNLYDFTNASLFYYRKFVYVAVPAEGLVLVYNMTDEKNPYWEAPQVLPISRFSIINGELYGHSSLVSETYKLFTGYADRTTSTSQGQPISATWAFSYESYGSRFSLKKATKMYVEGYINPNTILTANLLLDLDGCQTVKTFTLDGSDDQFVCLVPDISSLGKVSLGKEKLGGNVASSLQGLPPKFRWFPTFTNTNFFEAAISFSVIGLNERMELLAFGMATSGSSEIPVSKMD